MVWARLAHPTQKRNKSIKSTNESWINTFPRTVKTFTYNSVQFSHSVVSDCLWPHGLQHARPPCPWPTPRVYSNSCPLSRWCHPTISSSVIPFSSRIQSFPASRSFPMSQFFTSGGQSIGVYLQQSLKEIRCQQNNIFENSGIIESRLYRK